MRKKKRSRLTVLCQKLGVPAEEVEILFTVEFIVLHFYEKCSIAALHLEVA